MDGPGAEGKRPGLREVLGRGMRSEKGGGLGEGAGAGPEGSGCAVLKWLGRRVRGLRGGCPGSWEGGARELRRASGLGEGPSRRGAGPGGREEGVGERPGPKCSGKGAKGPEGPGKSGERRGGGSRTWRIRGRGGEPRGSREREEPYRKERVPDSGDRVAEGRGGGAGVSRRPGGRLHPSSRAHSDGEMLRPGPWKGSDRRGCGLGTAPQGAGWESPGRE